MILGPLAISLAYGFVAAVANLAGAWLCARGSSEGAGRLVAIRAVGAGFLVGVVAIDAVPAGLAAWRDRPWIAIVLALVGYGALHVIERFVSGHQHHGGHQHAQSPGSQVSGAAAWTGVAGLAIHTLLDGAAVAATAVTHTASGALVGLGLVAHQIPVGASAAALALSVGHSPGRARAAGGIVAGASVLGAVAFAFAAPLSPFALPLMAGVTSHVVVHDLLPTLGQGGRRRAVLLVGLGLLTYLATETLVSLALGGSP